MELGRPQHLLQSRPLGWLAWWLSPAKLLVSAAAHRLGQPSRLRRQLGISPAQLPGAKPHSPARLYSTWYRSSRLPSACVETWQSSRQRSSQHPARSAGKSRFAAKSLAPTQSSRRQPALKTAKPAIAAESTVAPESAVATRPPRGTSFRRSFWRISSAAVASKRISPHSGL